MKKDALMREFENLKIENANQVFGGMEDYNKNTSCDRDTEYETGTQKTTDHKTDRVVDDNTVVCESDVTRTVLPWIRPLP